MENLYDSFGITTELFRFVSGIFGIVLNVVSTLKRIGDMNEFTKKNNG
jgi:hypothetical protein